MNSPLLSDPVAVLFDLDDTLTESKQTVSVEMADAFTSLLELKPLAIVSGAKRAQQLEQFVEHLPAHAKLTNLFLFTQNAAECLVHDGTSWQEAYNFRLSQEEAERITSCLELVIKETGVLGDAPSYGERIENRGAQVTLSALGQQAPGELKRVWDKDHAKRKMIIDQAVVLLPEYQFGIGGGTSVDVTKKGVDKRLAVTWLSEKFGVDPKSMLYVGDGLFPGGNDTVVIQTGVTTQAVRNPEDTLEIITTLIAGIQKTSKKYEEE